MLNPQLFAMQNISEVKTILLARFKSVYVLRKDNPGNIQPTSVFPENYPQAVFRLFWLSHTDSIMLRSGICEWPTICCRAPCFYCGLRCSFVTLATCLGLLSCCSTNIGQIGQLLPLKDGIFYVENKKPQNTEY